VTPTPHRLRRRALLSATAVLCVLAVVPAAPHVGAQATVPAEVMVILASESPGTIAPELSGIAALRQPPFSSFPSMSLLATHPISLTLGTPIEVPLPNGRVLSVVVEERSEDGRYRARVAIPDYLRGFEVRAAPCEPFFLAGQAFSGGRLILGVRIGEGCH
jgi:hypothetical protein